MKLSKKLSAFVAAAVTALLAAWSGEITWLQALSGILAALIVYLGAQGAVDAAKAKNGGK